MESCQTPVVVKSRGRPRKRPREDDNNVNENVNGSANNDGSNIEESVGNARKRGRPPKKRVEIKGEAMVGKYVKKEFEGSGVFLGKIVGYDSGLYRVDYEDGDFEDLDSGELRAVLVGNERDTFVGEWLERKGELDERLEKKSSVKKDEVKKEGEVKTRVRSRKRDCVKVEEKVEEEKVEMMAVDKVGELDNGNVETDNSVKAEADIGNLESDAVKVEVPEVTEVPKTEGNVSDVDDGDGVYDYDSDSSSNWSEYGQGWEDRAETELPAIPPPELPPSSGNLGVPEEHVSHLFSVYGFLRSFSIRLFLSPFTLDDLVGCLNCTAPNTLLDSIHVALLRATRRHLESQASEGSQLASKCIR